MSLSVHQTHKQNLGSQLRAVFVNKSEPNACLLLILRKLLVCLHCCAQLSSHLTLSGDQVYLQV